jgi:hypothetical protein
MWFMQCLSGARIGPWRLVLQRLFSRLVELGFAICYSALKSCQFSGFDSVPRFRICEKLFFGHLGRISGGIRANATRLWHDEKRTEHERRHAIDVTLFYSVNDEPAPKVQIFRLVENTQMLGYLIDAIANDTLVILSVYPEYPEIDVLGN